MSSNNPSREPTSDNISKLTPKQISDFREAFSLFDQNNDNSITSAEIAKVFESLGQKVTEEQLKDILQADKDGNGEIDFQEFLEMMAEKLEHQDTHDEKQLKAQVHAAFRMFDANSDGKIDLDELLQAMQSLGEEVTLAEAKQMLEEADTDGDGYIDEQEFARTMFQF